jgi:hypothetical protein
VPGGQKRVRAEGLCLSFSLDNEMVPWGEGQTKMFHVKHFAFRLRGNSASGAGKNFTLARAVRTRSQRSELVTFWLNFAEPAEFAEADRSPWGVPSAS